MIFRYSTCNETGDVQMVKVLRVELKFSILDDNFKRTWDSTNIGPYVGIYKVRNIGGYSFLHLRTSMEFQPEPCDDNMKHVSGKLFGFKDMDQFLSWFRDDMAVLDWSGYALAEYEVPESDIVHGDHQIAFSKQNATLIKYFDSCRDVYKNHRYRSRQVIAA